MKSVKILSLVLAIALMVSFTACFNVKIVFPDAPDTTQPTQAVQPSDTTLPADTTVPAPVTDESLTDATLPSAEQTEPSAQDTTVPQPSTQAPEESTAEAPEESTTQAPKTPDQMNKDELLQFFNASLNRIKTDNIGFKKSKLTSILDLQLSNSVANTLVGFVKGALLSETADETTVAKGQSGVDVFSPPGKPYVSVLEPGDLTSITCTKNGDLYVIDVAVKSETNPTWEGSAMSRGFDFMTVDDVVNIYAPKVGATVAKEDIEVVFSDCTAKLTVTADGQVQAFTTYVKGVMNMYNASIKKGLTINTDLAITLASTTDYTDFVY